MRFLKTFFSSLYKKIQPVNFLDHPVVSRRLFFPRQKNTRPNFIVDTGEATLGCHLFPVDPTLATLVHFHGNGELAYDYIETGHSKVFTSLGINVCFAEYRGFGASSSRPTLVAMKDDGEHIVRKLNVAPEKVIVFGRSLGSLYAIELADRLPQIAGLILESAVADLLEDTRLDNQARRLRVSKEALVEGVRREFDLKEKLQRFQGPLLIMHCENDSLVNKSHAERLLAWAGSKDKRLVLFQSGDHNTILRDNREDYSRELETFIQRIGASSAQREVSEKSKAAHY
ncbi:MAG TPA: alpha/beta hydrolase [Burkholderiales bacterium]|jgi:pimeloyl-ACP methyl ester carboxylesterase|nr:alpha/beta hydrolase [Burkholderiales bacterium]